MWAQAIPPTVSAVAGLLGVWWLVVRGLSAAAQPAPLTAALALPPAALLIAACAALLAPPAPADRRAGWRRAVPVYVALALLPIASLLPAPGQRWGIALLLLLAALWLSALRSPPSAAGAGVLLRSTDANPSRLWTLFLLALAVAVGVTYIAIGTQTREIAQNDGAYYYGIARHMALSGRFEEPLVWHFLHPPDTLVHPPFDYWGCLTALLLVPSLWLFGAAPETAFVTMSAISAVALIAFWYLICVVLPLRYWMTQLLALVLFAFSPMMLEYRFQPESITVAQLAILLALVAFARRRFLVAIVFAFGVLLARGDGLILFGLTCAAVLLAQARDADTPPSRYWASLGTIFLCVATYVGWSWLSFGTLTPPAPRALPFLAEYWQVFDFGPAPERPWSELLHRFDWPYIRSRFELLRISLPLLWFTPEPTAWLALTAIPALALFRRRPPVEVLIWVLAVVGFLTVVWVAGPGFYIGRTPATFTPLFILAGSLGVDAVLARLDSWSAAGRAPARPLLATVVAFCLCAFFLTRLPALAVSHTAVKPRWRTSVGELDAMLGGEPVASNRRWYVIAYTGSPAVSVPYNGEAAIEAALRRYGARWVVLFGRPPAAGGESRRFLQALASGSKRAIGALRLERVPAPASLSVFRIIDPAAEPGGTTAKPPDRS
jgi:hypothetical protein